MFNVINFWSHRGNPKQLEYTQHKHQSNHLLEPLNFQKIYLVFHEEKNPECRILSKKTWQKWWHRESESYVARIGIRIGVILMDMVGNNDFISWCWKVNLASKLFIEKKFSEFVTTKPSVVPKMSLALKLMSLKPCLWIWTWTRLNLESTKLKISMWQNITETLIYFLDNEDIQDKKSVNINQQKEHLSMYINKFNPFCTLFILFHRY